MGFMSGFLQGAEGMNNIQNQWLQMNATRAQQQAAQDTRDAQATAQATQELQQNNSSPAQAVNTGVTPPASSSPDGTQPAPGPAPVSSTPLADPSSLPDPDSAMGEPDGEKKSHAITKDLEKGMKSRGIDVNGEKDLDASTLKGSDANVVDPLAATTATTTVPAQALPAQPPAQALGTGYVPPGVVPGASQGQGGSNVGPDASDDYLNSPQAQAAMAGAGANIAAGQSPAPQPGMVGPQEKTTYLPTGYPNTNPSPYAVDAPQMPPGVTVPVGRAPGALMIDGTPVGTTNPFSKAPGAQAMAPMAGVSGARPVLNPDPTGKPPPSQSVPAVKTDVPSSQPTFAQRAMGLFGVSTAMADELPPNVRPGASSLPGGKTPPAQPTAPPTTNPKAAALPMAKTDGDDSKDTGYHDPGAAPSAPISTAIPKGGPTATTGTKVVPDQKTPTNQSQPPVPPSEKVRIPPYDPKPYAALIVATKDTDPAKAQAAEAALATLEKAAKDTGVPADQLALHWNMEAEMRATDVPRGKDGEIGPFQILPSTWDMVDPNHLYDPNTLDGGAHIAGLILNPLNSSYGVGSPATQVGYNGGPQNAARYYAGKLNEVPQKALDYAQKCHPGQTISPANCTTPPNVDPAALQAAMKAGPDATMRYVAQTAPDSTPLGQKWQAAETSLVYASLMKGDVAGAQQAQELILGMSRQGASNALMNADRALAAGDGTTAAQQLAVAHAFFPDGSYGKFGVDSQGQVWAQQFSEKDPTLALGQPFQVTRQNLQPQLVMTSDPNKYLSAIQTLNQQNAQTEFEKQHGAYFGDLIKERADAAKERAVTAQQNAAEADATRRYALQVHSQDLEAQTKQHAKDVELQQSTGLLKEREGAQAKQQQDEAVRQQKLGELADKEAETFFGPEALAPKNGIVPEDLKGITPQQLSMGALAYAAIRRNHTNDGPMPSATAREMALSLARGSGAYSIGYDKDDNAVVRRKDDPAVPLAYIPKSAALRLLGSRRPPPVAPTPSPALATGRTPAMNDVGEMAQANIYAPAG